MLEAREICGSNVRQDPENNFTIIFNDFNEFIKVCFSSGVITSSPGMVGSIKGARSGSLIDARYEEECGEVSATDIKTYQT